MSKEDKDSRAAKKTVKTSAARQVSDAARAAEAVKGSAANTKKTSAAVSRTVKKVLRSAPLGRKKTSSEFSAPEVPLQITTDPEYKMAPARKKTADKAASAKKLAVKAAAKATVKAKTPDRAESKSEPKSAAKTVSKAAPKSAAKTVSKAAAKSAAKTVSKAAAKSAAKTVSRAAAKSAAKAEAKPAAKVADYKSPRRKSSSPARNNRAVRKNKDFTDKQLEEFRKMLLKMREEYTSQVKALSSSLHKQDEENTSEDGSNEFERSTNLCKAGSDQGLVSKIDAAIKAIADGTFGLCEECGELIGLSRLKAVPYATTCINCQSGRDSGKQFRRNKAMDLWM